MCTYMNELNTDLAIGWMVWRNLMWLKIMYEWIINWYNLIKLELMYCGNIWMVCDWLFIICFRDVVIKIMMSRYFL